MVIFFRVLLTYDLEYLNCLLKCLGLKLIWGLTSVKGLLTEY